MDRTELRLVHERLNGKTLDIPGEEGGGVGSVFERELAAQRQRRDEELRRDVTRKAASRRPLSA